MEGEFFLTAGDGQCVIVFVTLSMKVQSILPFVMVCCLLVVCSVYCKIYIRVVEYVDRLMDVEYEKTVKSGMEQWKKKGLLSMYAHCTL